MSDVVVEDLEAGGFVRFPFRILITSWW